MAVTMLAAILNYRQSLVIAGFSVFTIAFLTGLKYQ